MIKTRIQAFLFHFLISALAIIGLYLVVITLWYPKPFVSIGAITGLQIIIGVDLVLGPLLTLLVFDIKKKSLKFDLSIIAFIQLACFVGGTWVLFNERPVAQILTDKEIHVITASDFNYFDIQLDNHESTTLPPSFLLGLPDDWSQIPSLELTTEFVDGIPFVFRTDLYIPFDKIDDIEFNNRILKMREKIGSSVDEIPNNDENCDWVPITSAHASGNACVNLKSGIIKLSEPKSFFNFN